MSPTTSPAIDLSVIIPTHRPGPSLFRLLASLERQEAPPVREIIVVANPPSPALERALRRKNSSATYRACPSPGANHARNLGVDHARGQILVFLDDDCELDSPTFLREHFFAHRDQPQLAALGGPYLPPRSRWPLFRSRALTYHRIQEKWLLAGQKDGEVKYLLGGNCSFKARVARQHRFDPLLRFGGTETELFLRLKTRGLRLGFLPQLSLVHHSAPSLVSLLKKSFWQGMGSAYLQAKLGMNEPAAELGLGRRTLLETFVSVSFVAGQDHFLETSAAFATTKDFSFKLARECLRRLRAVPFNRFFTEAHACIAGALERPGERQTPRGEPRR